jgi:hypothetical protein
MNPKQAFQTLQALSTSTQPQQVGLLARIVSAALDAPAPEPVDNSAEIAEVRDRLLLTIANLTSENEALTQRVAELTAAATAADETPTTRRTRGRGKKSANATPSSDDSE